MLADCRIPGVYLIPSQKSLRGINYRRLTLTVFLLLWRNSLQLFWFAPYWVPLSLRVARSLVCSIWAIQRRSVPFCVVHFGWVSRRWMLVIGSVATGVNETYRYPKLRPMVRFDTEVYHPYIHQHNRYWAACEMERLRWLLAGVVKNFHKFSPTCSVNVNELNSDGLISIGPQNNLSQFKLGSTNFWCKIQPVNLRDWRSCRIM